MRLFRLYADAAGRDHVEQLALKRQDNRRPKGEFSLLAVKGAFVRDGFFAGLSGWHTAPQRQYVVTLSGQWEIELRDGTKQSFGPGDILLAEDIHGEGHLRRVLGQQPAEYLVLPLAELS